MSNYDLIPDDIRQQNAVDIASYDTFKTHGVSEQTAKNYLKTPEGMLYLTRLNEAFPNSTIDEIRKKALS